MQEKKHENNIKFKTQFNSQNEIGKNHEKNNNQRCTTNGNVRMLK
jgi:hypothetical protein